MPSKRGSALRSKVVGKERKFEEAHRRLEEKRRRRAEAEREAARQEPAGAALAGGTGRAP